MCWRQLAHNLSSGSKHTYDAQNQLTKEEHYDGLGTGSSHITETYEYTYDTAGNILSEKVDGTVTKTYAYNDTYWGDKLTSFNGMTISYDGVGNPLLYVSGSDLCTLTWQHGRQLATAFVDNVMYRYDLTFSYDADGIRTSKDVDGTVHYYLTQNGKVVRETIGTGSTARVLDFIYDESGKPLAVRDSHDGGSTFATYYYVLNLQGDVVKLIGASGTVYANYAYNAWGELLSVTNASGNVITDYSHISHVNPLRYRGYYYDRETGWYYLQSRYYDPSMHRFINADTFASTGQGLLGCNMFAYCNNNPVNYTDYSGRSATLVAWLTTYAALHWWNPTGWAAAAAIALAVAGLYIGDYLYDLYLEENTSYVEVPAISAEDSVSTPAAPPPNNKNNKNKKYKSENNTPGNNQAQNKQVDSIAKKFKMNKAQRRELHDAISGQGYSYWEIAEIAGDIMGVYLK